MDCPPISLLTCQFKSSILEAAYNAFSAERMGGVKHSAKVYPSKLLSTSAERTSEILRQSSYAADFVTIKQDTSMGIGKKRWITTNLLSFGLLVLSAMLRTLCLYLLTVYDHDADSNNQVSSEFQKYSSNERKSQAWQAATYTSFDGL